MRPIHPGEVLRDAFLGPLDLGALALAKALRVPITQINDVVNERRRTIQVGELNFPQLHLMRTHLMRRIARHAHHP